MLDPLTAPVQLANFAIRETARAFEIDLNGGSIAFSAVDTQQLELDTTTTAITERDLVVWLDTRTRRRDLMQTTLQAYLTKQIAHLIHDRGFKLTALVRAQHQLAQAITAELDRLRDVAISTGFQQSLVEMAVPPPEQAVQFSFRYHPGQYPFRNPYRGRYRFKKHFYPEIHDLREKTSAGQPAEEFVCAQQIDVHPKVKHWVRNIERAERTSFWLPTATDYFYPDFVAELTDGRLLVVEYKGEPYKTNDDSREKHLVGQRWEASSGGRCLFLFAVETDDQGRNVAKQIADKIG